MHIPSQEIQQIDTILSITHHPQVTTIGPHRCGGGRQGDTMLLEMLPAAIRAPTISPLIDG